MSGFDLRTMQEWMQGAVIGSRAPQPAEMENILLPSPRLAARDRLAIYQRSYLMRLLSCLREQFPALCHALGEDLFDGFAREYLRELPSESYTLCDLGKRFSDYLEQNRPDREAPAAERESWIDFMVDLSRFERAVFVLFDAPGHEGKPFATADTPDERLRLQPCFALHESRFPVAPYYHQVRSGLAPELPEQEDAKTALFRVDYIVRSLPLANEEFQFLRSLSEGLEIRDLIRDSGETPDAGKVWTANRSRWIQSGVLIPVL